MRQRRLKRVVAGALFGGALMVAPLTAATSAGAQQADAEGAGAASAAGPAPAEAGGMADDPGMIVLQSDATALPTTPEPGLAPQGTPPPAVLRLLAPGPESSGPWHPAEEAVAPRSMTADRALDAIATEYLEAEALERLREERGDTLIFLLPGIRVDDPAASRSERAIVRARRFELFEALADDPDDTGFVLGW